MVRVTNRKLDDNESNRGICWGINRYEDEMVRLLWQSVMRVFEHWIVLLTSSFCGAL